ncbi:MAG: phage major capsid protein [Actinobacteria bacterium]|nr:phage major capsid protein [Actinomycetota bacterium]
MTIVELKEQIRKGATDALGLVQAEDKTPAEKRAALDKAEAAIKAWQAELANLEAVDDARGRFTAAIAAASDSTSTSSTGGVTHDPASPAPSAPELRSLGGQFVASKNYSDLRERMANGGLKGTWSTGPVDLKTTVTEGAGSGNAFVVTPRVLPGIVPLLFRRLTIADLLPAGATDGPNIRYIKETTFTNAAATVAEAANKPESTLVYDIVDEAVKKIAHFLPVSDEMLEDVAQVRSYIDGRLVLGVQLTEEDQLLNGNGTGTNLTGLLNRSGLQAAQAVGTDTRVDAIYKEITKIRANAFLEPSGIVVHPTDWQTIRLSKDSQGQYYGGGPFTGAYGNGPIPETLNTGGAVNVNGDSLWGLPVVVTPAIATGTALVGAFSQATQVFRRGGITVEASNSHASFFIQNLVAIRAEERLALAVYRPAGLGTVTGL